MAKAYAVNLYVRRDDNSDELSKPNVNIVFWHQIIVNSTDYITISL